MPGSPRTVRSASPRRIATLSVHTSPLDQPGTGDAGGMNVYIVETAKRLAELGVESDIFTRSTSKDLPPLVELHPGVNVRHVAAGEYEGLSKSDLPGVLCSFTTGVLRAEAQRDPGHYDLLHSHYWMSGQVGLVAKDRWGVPLVHSMHTMAKVKNALLATGDTPEPSSRVAGESQVVRVADRLVANTSDEARQLVELYGAQPDDVAVVWPGVDLAVFTPGDRNAARARLGIPLDVNLVLFVGRIQPLKAPDVLLRAVSELVERQSSFGDDVMLAVVGGPSGSGLEHPEYLHKLAADLGIADLVRFAPPATQSELVDWYRASDVTVVPSYNESFGLVAVEAQACGTPVVASAVGGLTTAVHDGVSGVLIDGHNPTDYAQVLRRLLSDAQWREQLGRAGVERTRQLGWAQTADAMLDVYRDVMYARANEQVAS